MLNFKFPFEKSQDKQISNFKFANGFTLIELLVVFSLIAVITGIGLVSLVSYSRAQTVKQAAAEVKQMIDLAKFNSLSFVKPERCTDALAGYKLDFCANTLCQRANVDYEIVVLCTTDDPVVQFRNFPSNISTNNIGLSEPCTSITFNINKQTQGIPCEINVAGYNNQVKLSVDSVGYVTY